MHAKFSVLSLNIVLAPLAVLCEMKINLFFPARRHTEEIHLNKFLKGLFLCSDLYMLLLMAFTTSQQHLLISGTLFLMCDVGKLKLHRFEIRVAIKLM